jgi:hypothetical protein
MSRAEIHGEKREEKWVEVLALKDEGRLVGQSDERCRERWAESVEEQVKVQTSEQARVNWLRGSGELSDENPVELSAQLLMLQFAIDDVRLSIGEHRRTGTKSDCRMEIADIKVQIGEANGDCT